MLWLMSGALIIVKMSNKKKQKKKSEPASSTNIRIDYVHPEKISVHFLCVICQEIFTDPVFIDCGHVYCRPCIAAWLKSKVQCPQCRKPVKRDFITPCYIAR